MDKLHVLRARREAAKERWQNRTIGADLYATVGMGTCGLAAGAEEAVEAIRREAARRGPQCRNWPGGLCWHVLVRADGRVAGP